MDTQLELLTKKWDGILQTIRQENDLSNVAFKTWLLPLKVFRIEDHVLKITAPFEQAATYVENKYKTFLYVAVAEAMGEEYEIKIITEDEASRETAYVPPAKKMPAPVPMDDQKTNLNPKYTFDTFVIGSITGLPMQHPLLLRNLREKSTIRCFYMEALDLEKPI